MTNHLCAKKTALVLGSMAVVTAFCCAQTPIQQEAIALVKRADALKQQKKTAEAIAIYEKAAALAPKAFGVEAASTGNVYHNLAELYEATGQLEKAVVFHEKNLKIREVRWGDDSHEAGMVMNNLAILYKTLGRFAKAEPLYRKFVEIVEAKLGPDDAEYGKALNNLALFLSEAGRHNEVEPLLLKSLKIYEAAKGPDHPDVAIPLGNLAETCRFFGQHRRAEEMIRRCLKLREDKLGPDDNDVAITLINLAALLNETGRSEQAGANLRRALSIFEKNLGPEDPKVAVALNNLATHLNEIGQLDEAEALLKRCLEIYERGGPTNPSIALARHNLGFLSLQKGEYRQAEESYRKALKLREAIYGPDSELAAVSRSDLSSVLTIQGKFQAALELLHRSLATYERVFPPDHPHIAGALGGLASLHDNLGQPERATPLWLRSLEIYRKQFGNDHPATSDRLRSLATHKASLRHWDEAVAFMHEGQRSQRNSLVRVLSGLAEAEQVRFLQSAATTGYHSAVSLGRLRIGDAKHEALAAEWVMNAKGLAHEVLAERTLLLRDLQQAEKGDKVKQLLSLRKQIAGLTFTDAAAIKGVDRQQLLDLLGKEEELSRTLQLGRTLQAGWVELAAARQALPAGAVLVEMARYDFNDYTKPVEKRYRGAHYAAWVIPAAGQGEVRMVLLGPAEPIEQAVTAARRNLKESPNLIRKLGEVEAEKRTRAALAVLAKLVYAPLAKELSGAKQWLLSPDASLWLVPWCALPLDDRSYAVEKHSIRYLTSGRDLVGKASTVSKAPALILANPDFDLDPAEAALEARKQRVDPEGIQQRNLLPGEKFPRAEPLPATAAEAEAVEPRLAALTGTAPKVYVEKQALESAFKAARQPRVLLLSTHGFFLEDQRSDPATAQLGDALARRAAGKLQENPLLRCGLLLAGCNRRGDQRPPDLDDGILTGLEVLEADLRGTELVVLSACDTGVGVIQNGEGVAGLKRAFQLAGARTVLATHWPIPDLQSAQLMVQFFTKLSDRLEPTLALQEAQRTMIEDRRQRNAAAHPYFWAAFSVTGSR